MPCSVQVTKALEAKVERLTVEGKGFQIHAEGQVRACCLATQMPARCFKQAGAGSRFSHVHCSEHFMMRVLHCFGTSTWPLTEAHISCPYCQIGSGLHFLIGRRHFVSGPIERADQGHGPYIYTVPMIRGAAQRI